MLLFVFSCNNICFTCFVHLFSSPNDGIVNYALSSLHNLLLHIDQAKLEILRCGGCQKMVGRLTSRGSKFLAMLTDCLHMLAFNNEEVKIIIESSDGPQQLLRILDSNDYEKLLWTTTRLLRVLSVSPSIKIVMVSKNAIKILEKHLSQSKSLRIRQNSLQILRNLSDQAVKLVIILFDIFVTLSFQNYHIDDVSFFQSASSRKTSIHFCVY